MFSFADVASLSGLNSLPSFWTKCSSNRSLDARHNLLGFRVRSLVRVLRSSTARWRSSASSFRLPREGGRSRAQPPSGSPLPHAGTWLRPCPASAGLVSKQAGGSAVSKRDFNKFVRKILSLCPSQTELLHNPWRRCVL